MRERKIEKDRGRKIDQSQQQAIKVALPRRGGAGRVTQTGVAETRLSVLIEVFGVGDP